MKVRKAVIPAAGLGTRLLPATKAQPKEMLPIIDKPVIQYIVEEAVDSGIEDIIIITNKGKRSIEDHFDRSVELEVLLQSKGNLDLFNMVRKISNLANIYYVRQKEILGLGHAIYCARKIIGEEPFAVLLGDDVIKAEVPCLKQMLKVHETYGGSILGVQEVNWEETKKYGIVKGKLTNPNLYQVEELIEKPQGKEAPSRLAILGRYILEPTIFSFLEKQQPGIGGEIQLTDALREINRIYPVYAYNFSGKRYDLGDRWGYVQAIIEFALQREDLGSSLKHYLMELMQKPHLIDEEVFLNKTREKYLKVKKASM